MNSGPQLKIDRIKEHFRSQTSWSHLKKFRTLVSQPLGRKKAPHLKSRCLPYIAVPALQALPHPGCLGSVSTDFLFSCENSPVTGTDH